MKPSSTSQQHETVDQDDDSSNNIGVYEALQAEYRDMAGWYDSFWRDYLTKTFQLPLRLVRTAILNQQERNLRRGANSDVLVVVDIACGTGEFLKRVIGTLPAVETNRTTKVTFFYGVEPCHEMLEQARQKFRNVDKTENGVLLAPTWIECSAESLPLDNACADIVCSTSAFHFFRNKSRALFQMKRALKPDGQLIITDWCGDYLLVRLYHILELLRWNVRFLHRYPGPLSSSKLCQAVVDAGFEQVKVETYTVCFWTVVVWGMQTVTACKPAMHR